MRIAFFGSSSFGIPTLEYLCREHELVGIVTQPDRPAGRGGRVRATPVGTWVERHAAGKEMLKPERVNAAEVIAQIRGWGAEAWVVIAYGQKLGRALLEGVFAINLHASLLPRWRGAAPIQAAMLAGDEETGNCVITLADRMDAGLILAEERLPIEQTQTAGEMHDRLAAMGPGLVGKVLEAHLSGKLAPVAQDEARVTMAPKISSADGWVDFAHSAKQCRQRINGLSPSPGVTVCFRGESLKLLRAVEIPEMASGGGEVPGAFVDGMGGCVACGGGTVLRLLEVQPAGKRAMSWAEFANGRKPRQGELLGQRPGN